MLSSTAECLCFSGFASTFLSVFLIPGLCLSSVQRSSPSVCSRMFFVAANKGWGLLRCLSLLCYTRVNCNTTLTFIQTCKLNSSWENACAQWAGLLVLSCSLNPSALKLFVCFLFFLLLSLCFFQISFFVMETPKCQGVHNYRVFVGQFPSRKGQLGKPQSGHISSLCVSGLGWDSAGHSPGSCGCRVWPGWGSRELRVCVESSALHHCLLQLWGPLQDLLLGCSDVPGWAARGFVQD